MWCLFCSMLAVGGTDDSIQVLQRKHQQPTKPSSLNHSQSLLLSYCESNTILPTLSHLYSTHLQHLDQHFMCLMGGVCVCVCVVLYGDFFNQNMRSRVPPHQKVLWFCCIPHQRNTALNRVAGFVFFDNVSTYTCSCCTECVWSSGTRGMQTLTAGNNSFFVFPCLTVKPIHSKLFIHTHWLRGEKIRCPVVLPCLMCVIPSQ